MPLLSPTRKIAGVTVRNGFEGVEAVERSLGALT